MTLKREPKSFFDKQETVELSIYESVIINSGHPLGKNQICEFL
jgi:hypothetical protein